ncbi:MAG: hypothetical protein L0K86_14340 [Actinomycetia bacterium]|nr:hypothetical protein [Actinomycetes bacterium]
MSSSTRRLVSAVSGGLLAAAIITGCGDDGGGGDDSDSSAGGDYCGQVEEMKGDFEAFGDPDYTLGDISETVGLIGDISESAPDDIASSWDSLHSAMSDFESKIAGFGVDEDAPLQGEFEKLAKEDPSKKQEIITALSSMDDVKSDADKIEKNVKDACDIDLSGDSGNEDSGDADDGADSGS